MELFNFFYRLKDLYGPALFYHLKGWDAECQCFNAQYYQFPSIFLTTVGICLGVAVLYYWIIDHPRWNRYWVWLITLAVVAASTMFYGWLTVYIDVTNGKISYDLIDQISYTNAWMFGLYNMILACLFYLLFSVICKNIPLCKNCKHSPLRSPFTPKR